MCTRYPDFPVIVTDVTYFQNSAPLAFHKIKAGEVALKLTESLYRQFPIKEEHQVAFQVIDSQWCEISWYKDSRDSEVPIEFMLERQHISRLAPT